jgi:hypothetical protein
VFCLPTPTNQTVTIATPGYVVTSIPGALAAFTPGTSFGSDIATNGGTFSSLVVQPGTYLINLTATDVPPLQSGDLAFLLLNGVPVSFDPNLFTQGVDQAGVWRMNVQMAVADLVQVSAPNTVVQLALVTPNVSPGGTATPAHFPLGCRLILQRLQ